MSRARDHRVVASTGGRLASFAPFVAAIDAAQRVSFTARTTGGAWAVMLEEEGSAFPLFETTSRLTSHPVTSPRAGGRGALAVYATLEDGDAIVVGDAVAPRVMRAEEVGLARVGPLGPTVARDGEIAIRASGLDGVARVLVVTPSLAVVEVARAGGEIAAFHGLPVALGGGRVLLRVSRPGGAGAVIVRDAAAAHEVASESDGVTELSEFVHAGPSGEIVFAARRAGERGVFVREASGVTRAVVTERDGFASFRGALAYEGGVVFYATPKGGELAVFDTAGGRLLGLGDPTVGAPVRELALNPASITASGAIALRVSLADGAEHILAC